MTIQTIAPILKITSLQAGYDRRAVLHDVSLTVDRGEWCTVLGPNGVGKSTLLQCVVGQITPLNGAVYVDGHDLAGDRSAALRRVGFACPPEKLPGLMTGRDCLRVYAAAKELDEIDPVVLELSQGLRFSGYLDHYVDTYSLGTRQKLSVLLALLGNPSLIVLDEAFNGLDPASALVLKRHLRAQVDAGSCAVLLATHALDIVERFSDSAVLLLDGRVVRKWDRAELNALIKSHEGSLDMALAAAVVQP